MAVPVVVSPFLRPFRAAGDGNALLIDDGIAGGTFEPTPLEAALLAALWPGTAEADALAGLTGLAAAHGDAAVGAALAALADRGAIFEDDGAARAALALRRERARPEVPFVDQVELTNACPMKCGFCPRGIPDRITRPVGFMERAIFERLLDQLHPEQARYRAFELHHLGESLLHPELVDFVRLAGARGLPTELSVNPSHLAPELGRGLVDAGLRRLVISLDGVDAPTLARIRGPAARFDRAERNLEALLGYLAGVAQPPTVVIQMIDLAANRHQHAAFLARWGATGLPFVHAYVKDLDGADPTTGAPNAEPLTFLCSYPWRSVVVLWDGRVVPCCRDDDARLVLGDLHTESLRAIWNGAAAARLREALHAGQVPCGHLCDGCAWRTEAFVAAAPHRHPDRARRHALAW